MNNILGRVLTMTVLRKMDTGYVLQKNAEEVLLHHNETVTELEEGQDVNVFLYQDKKEQTIASAKLPHIEMDVYGWAEVIEVIPRLGAFVDIGTTKDMLVSSDDLPLFEDVWPAQGDLLYVTLGKDRKGRILAIPATEGVLAREFERAPEDLLNKQVQGRVYLTSKEGTAIITDADYRGFIHHSERQEEPRLGQLVQGRVIEVKEDGTLNISLRPLKQHSMGDDADKILSFLQENDGVIPFGDKSDPEDIRGTFNASKAAFKRALGKLMKEGQVEQRDGNTLLHEKKSD
jgi:predicted RNA-binding protein (virulence factor B family)